MIIFLHVRTQFYLSRTVGQSIISIPVTGDGDIVPFRGRPLIIWGGGGAKRKKYSFEGSPKTGLEGRWKQIRSRKPHYAPPRWLKRKKICLKGQQK